MPPTARPSPEKDVLREEARDAHLERLAGEQPRVLPGHAPRRSQVVLVEPALSQLPKLTATETHRLDRAIVAISVNPELGAPVPDTLLRDHVDDIDGVRVVHYVTPFDRS
ncbi:hypothetical protein PUR49_06365 [Streptomyces sp. BE147]|uniref:hypothetical protein n=1 Tax=Streptomyces sp. BE147 TaxID=3002524 RepID=UPI002E7A3CDE|nr:hypothetical protein [Streptomyces sp. BE147]MEE1736139.1 hypothetical protein [Streptomyces sp. BE147]